MKVVVIGGGVIGLWSALELTRAGAEVTVVDAGPLDGFASPAAAGWVVPALSAPLSGPGVVVHSARQLLRGAAPFGITPAVTPPLLRWLWGFVRSGTAQQYDEGLRAVLRLGAGCATDFEQLQRSGIDLELRRTGLLMAAVTRAGLDEVRRLAEHTAVAGYHGGYDVLDGDGARSREPALGNAVIGAVHAAAEVQVKPEQVLVALRGQLATAGGRIIDGTVRTPRPAGRGWRVETEVGPVEADRLLCCAGIWTRELLAPLGVRIPLLAATGYAITVPAGEQAPRIAVKLVEPSIAVTPFASGVRVAARLDLGRAGRPAGDRRIAGVLRRTLPYFEPWRAENPGQVRTGMRPATPDSLPLIGGVPGHPGLYVAAGHGMLGLTLAPGTARFVVPLVLDDHRPPELAPFALERYLRPGARVAPSAQPVRTSDE